MLWFSKTQSILEKKGNIPFRHDIYFFFFPFLEGRLGIPDVKTWREWTSFVSSRYSSFVVVGPTVKRKNKAEMFIAAQQQ